MAFPTRVLFTSRVSANISVTADAITRICHVLDMETPDPDGLEKLTV